jgi:DNA invertase Pin-like site-specific DNA recombinase
MSTKRPVRCAIYTRKSTEEGLEQDFNSLDAQRDAGEAYVTSQKAEGWITLRDRYDDGGYSGGTLERPALKRLLADIEAGAVDVVVVYKIDRLSRSLMDFAKLVEVFDRRSVTFVSVTQSFNTTNSMGRLTLNVLLSFAQFEREVTGERIRDKFAASKKKGIWMGGNPPLGYDVANRKLVVNETEAETVRHIFQRYLELGCVRLLCADLATSGIVSKHRVFQSGERRGGRTMGRSSLYALLNNRAYLGETVHKGHYYKGVHVAIVPKALFDAVQERLAELAPALSGKARAPQDAPFTGLLFDETGEAMLPTYSVKGTGARYRYYASRPNLKGERSNAVIVRIPAPALEDFLAGVLSRLGLPSIDQPDQLRAAIHRIEVQANAILLRLHRAHVVNHWRALNRDAAHEPELDIVTVHRAALASGETLNDEGRYLVLTLPVRARFRGGRAATIYPSGSRPSQPALDMAFIKAIARAHRWRRMLVEGEANSIEELALRLGQDRGHVGLTLKLAYLSPAMTRAILRGEQPTGLCLTRIINADLPLSWCAQTREFGQPAHVADA